MWYEPYQYNQRTICIICQHSILVPIIPWTLNLRTVRKIHILKNIASSLCNECLILNNCFAHHHWSLHARPEPCVAPFCIIKVLGSIKKRIVVFHIYSILTARAYWVKPLRKLFYYCRQLPVHCEQVGGIVRIAARKLFQNITRVIERIYAMKITGIQHQVMVGFQAPCFGFEYENLAITCVSCPSSR